MQDVHSLYSWLLFGLLILSMLMLDFFVFHRKGKHVSMTEALLWSAFWVGLALLFSLYVYVIRGKEDALNFLTGYLIEESLSLDNLFVFLLIFDYFKTPKAAYHKVLFWGIFGAIVMRALLIASGLSIIKNFHWVIYILGGFLIYTGVKFWFSKDIKVEPEKNVVLKLFRSYFPVHPTYVGDRFFVNIKGQAIATPLFIVLLCIETTDLVFAVDSIPAILAITYDPFIVYTSNIFALLGLRTLFFALAELMKLFYYLHYGLACILVLIGFKMVMSAWITLPILIVLGVVLTILTGSIVLSFFIPAKQNH
jgi:tellurite resistance protein TerC